MAVATSCNRAGSQVAAMAIDTAEPHGLGLAMGLVLSFVAREAALALGGGLGESRSGRAAAIELVLQLFETGCGGLVGREV